MKREWVLCIFYFRLTVTHLWHIVQSESASDHWEEQTRGVEVHCVFKGRSMGRSAFCGLKSGMLREKRTTFTESLHISVMKAIKNKCKYLLRIAQTIIFHLYFICECLSYGSIVSYYINVLSHRTDTRSTVFKVYFKLCAIAL